jgi:hypothetical protein
VKTAVLTGFFYSGGQTIYAILKNRQISRCEKLPFLPVSETAVVRPFMYISKTEGNCGFFKGGKCWHPAPWYLSTFHY